MTERRARRQRVALVISDQSASAPHDEEHPFHPVEAGHGCRSGRADRGDADASTILSTIKSPAAARPDSPTSKSALIENGAGVVGAC